MGDERQEPDLAAGQTWRSPKTWWRIKYIHSGTVFLEGPRGSFRMSRDGGLTWSELCTTMTRDGFLAWVRKTGACIDSHPVETVEAVDA